MTTDTNIKSFTEHIHKLVGETIMFTKTDGTIQLWHIVGVKEYIEEESYVNYFTYHIHKNQYKTWGPKPELRELLIFEKRYDCYGGTWICL